MYFKNEIYFREFTLLSSGKRHYKNTHEAISHECILCHKTLKNDSAYVLHLKKNHDVTKKQIEEAKVIKMQEQDYLLVISEKNVVGFRKINFFKFYGKVSTWVSYLGYFSISFEKITFYTEILTRKVELWTFSLVSLLKKQHKTTFRVKISV